MEQIRRWLTLIGALTAHPLAFLIVGIYVAVWLTLSPRSFDWQSAATVATWLMTVLIQRAETRDTLAIHAKLDELLRVEGAARTELTKLDEKEPEEIKRHRADAREMRNRRTSNPSHETRSMSRINR
jgi:low affinity Fe/Cu permease